MADVVRFEPHLKGCIVRGWVRRDRARTLSIRTGIDAVVQGGGGRAGLLVVHGELVAYRLVCLAAVDGHQAQDCADIIDRIDMQRDGRRTGAVAKVRRGQASVLNTLLEHPT